MQIDFSKMIEADSHRFKDWRFNFLLHVLTEHTKNADDWKEKLGIDLSQRPTMIDMKVTVNGHEVPFDKWIEHMEKAYSDMLEVHAKKFLSEKVSKIQYLLSRLEHEAECAVDDSIAVQSGECVSTSWILNQLSGMSFPEQGSAHDFIKKSLGK